MTARRTSGPFQCGFCAVRDHARCVGAVHGGVSGLMVCQCCKQGERCLSCGATEEVAAWSCTDPSGCRGRVIARRNLNPMWVELQECQRKSLEPQMALDLGGEDR